MSEIDKLENQVILRVPDDLADQLHELFDKNDPKAQDFIGKLINLSIRLFLFCFHY
jgi:hypothetical protein